MATTLEQISAYLNDIGVGIEEINTEKAQIALFVHPLNLPLRCYINLRNNGQHVKFTCYPQIADHKPLDAIRREQVLERINEFNYKFNYGRWAMDDDGDPRATFHLHLEDAELTRRQLWMVFFLIKDLIILQAQCLQLLIATGIQESFNEGLLSTIAISAAINNPSRVGEVAEALCLPASTARVLYEIVGETFVEQEDIADESFRPEAEVLLLN